MDSISKHFKKETEKQLLSLQVATPFLTIIANRQREKEKKMAQAHREEKIHENTEKDVQETSHSSFKFNVQAPEFVPRSHTPQPQVPISGYFYPCFQILGGSSDSDWFYVGDQDPSSCLIPTTNVSLPNSSKNILTPDLQLKIVKQVYLVYF